MQHNLMMNAVVLIILPSDAWLLNRSEFCPLIIKLSFSMQRSQLGVALPVSSDATEKEKPQQRYIFASSIASVDVSLFNAQVGQCSTNLATGKYFLGDFSPMSTATALIQAQL
jgi:hypothetical protein